ncbi:lipid-binding protein [Polaribacter sp. L3A8]|uniref:lipid-binding protein n=1 Tax=Polaribacter sp. L3A8 TaxID=2686361 RepID=UPI00131C7CB9|nr:lipid-binding protein [Polaribacter sp. L3A8]
MKNIKLLKITFFLTLILGFTSCDEGGDPDPGATSVVEMAGDWFVQLNGTGSYYHLSTYNTAADNGKEMWIEDLGTFWEFKAKTPVNTNELTFGGSNLASNYEGYEITINITNATISKGTATTSGGNTSDGISLDIEFSDDAGTVYKLVGYKRTGFSEDEH